MTKPAASSVRATPARAGVPLVDALQQVASAFAVEPDLAALFGSYDDEPAAANFLSQYKNLLHHYTRPAWCV